MMSEGLHDVVIVGASFAGLATAYFIEGSKILVLERQSELGSKQKSTCCTSQRWIEKLNCKGSVRKTFDYLTLHSSNGHSARIKLPMTFCTIDYREFCKTLADNLGNAEILTGKKVTSMGGSNSNKVVASGDSYSGRILVDCSGWKGFKENHIDRRNGTGRLKPAFGLEIETEFDGDTDSFHIYYGMKFTEKGYGWIFPTGEESASIGVCGYVGFKPGETLDSFLQILGIKRKEGISTHGGYLPTLGLSEPVRGTSFVVGDACWQVLPLSGEGIRKAFEYAEFCGKTITRVLHNELSLEEGLDTYRREVLKAKRFYDNLRFVQTLATYCPDWGRKRIIKSLSTVDGAKVEGLLQRYFNDEITSPKTRILKAVVGGILL
jgi:flavin-dependent dehydrogenase